MGGGLPHDHMGHRLESLSEDVSAAAVEWRDVTYLYLAESCSSLSTRQRHSSRNLCTSDSCLLTIASSCPHDSTESHTISLVLVLHYFLVSVSLWPPYGIGQAIIFSCCGFYLSSSSIFFSLPNLSGRRLDVYHTSTHGVALMRIQNAGLKRAAHGSLKIQDAKVAKNRHRGTIAQLCQAISSQLRQISTIRKKTC